MSGAHFLLQRPPLCVCAVVVCTRGAVRNGAQGLVASSCLPACTRPPLGTRLPRCVTKHGAHALHALTPPPPCTPGFPPVRDDVAVVTANPKTAGVARWIFLALWGVKLGKGKKAAMQFTTKVR